MKTVYDLFTIYRQIKRTPLVAVFFYLGLAYYLFFQIFPVALEFSALSGTLLLSMIFYFVFKSGYFLIITISNGLNAFIILTRRFLIRIIEDFRYLPRNFYRYISSLF